MNKLYLFGIGGTGSRVIRALTMLLASGVDTNGFEIIPIIVDPDAANGDVTRTVQALKDYQAIRRDSLSVDGKNQFFSIEINELTPGKNFKFDLGNTSDVNFGEYINVDGMDMANQAFVKLLFSESNLSADMAVGFKGNPNIGSVVLNQFKNSDEFKDLANNFKNGDRIFIISSIFGGTGAAGFPLLLKNIRSINPGFSNFKLLQDAPIGALSVLPYFNVAVNANSSIDGASFVSKAKAALSYYDVNISGNNSLNSFYYVADNHTSTQENHEGGTKQQNQAHFVELSSALAIIDFCKESTGNLSCSNGKAINPIYKEFGISQDSMDFGFENLGVMTKQIVTKPLSQFMLFSLYTKNKLKDATDLNWAKELKIKSLLGSAYYNHLDQFFTQYNDWLREMSQNQRGFSPFKFNVSDANLFEFINGYKAESSIFDKGGKGYGRFDYILSKTDKDVDNKVSGNARFNELFYLATEQLINSKYNF